MKCPVCQEKNLKSCVYPGTSTMTAAFYQPYYDENGIYHSHNGNAMTTEYSCSQGHSWIEKTTGCCPNCDFGSDKKVDIINSQEKIDFVDLNLTSLNAEQNNIVDGTI